MTTPKIPSNPNRTRDHLANERTYLAWIRTALALIGFGFIVVRFRAAVPTVPSSGHSLTLGLLLCAVGLLLVPFANWHYFRVLRAIEDETFEPAQRTISIASAVLVLIGISVLVYIFKTSTIALPDMPLAP